MAGLGAAINTGEVGRGDSVAVIGCGGVGNAAVAGARLAGASKIIALDLDDRKLASARKFGATHTVNSGTTDPVAAVRELTGGFGADVVIDAVGRPDSPAPGGSRPVETGAPGAATGRSAHRRPRLHRRRDRTRRAPHTRAQPRWRLPLHPSLDPGPAAGPAPGNRGAYRARRDHHDRGGGGPPGRQHHEQLASFSRRDCAQRPALRKRAPSPRMHGSDGASRLCRCRHRRVGER